MAQTFGATSTASEVVATFAERVEGRVFLITGPTAGGLGAETAYALARAHPSSIILVGRSPAKYASVVERIRAIDPDIDVHVYGLDLGSIASTREGARKIAADVDHIDVLINNAGVMGIPCGKNQDGIEGHFATNHIGHFLLTNILMPVILKSKEPNVVNLTSATLAGGTGDYSDYNFERHEYTWGRAYSQSKLANLHFTEFLAQKLGVRGLVTLAVHPGVIWGTSLTTSLQDEQLDKVRQRDSAAGIRTKSVEEGAATTLVAALDRELGKKHNGAYMADCQVTDARGPGARVPGAPKALWELSEMLVDEKFSY
ncbi:putative short-chain dehydrogenase [Auricularia subglabra TFB-10046 SS5]|nr:putative short-chain dehydrogenase [Auricularia subglabra TFB-10046 SS5]